MSEPMLKRTALYDSHIDAGARIVEFGGWEMPVQYSGIRPEHLEVRSGVGVFDISHMGQLMVSGPESAAFLNRALTNDIEKLSPGLGHYTLLCHDQNSGGTIDDLYVFCLNPSEYLLILNASRFDDDRKFLEGLLASYPGRAAVTLSNLSSSNSALALQGPGSPAIADALFGAVIDSGAPSGIPRNHIAALQAGGSVFGNGTILLSRTGYTGEDGFEIMAPHSVIQRIWSELTERHNVLPIGLGARDTLRLEAGYPLYGHELDEKTSPIEAGVKWAVALDKGDFSGRESIRACMDNPDRRMLIGLEMVDKAPPPRQGYALFSSADADEPSGVVTSGTLSPSLGKGIALGFVPKSDAAVGRNWWIEIRGKKFKAVQCRRSFLSKAG